MKDRLYAVLDYETRSRADLSGVGAYQYARHPSTRLLCASWRIGTRATLPSAPIRKWSPILERRVPTELIEAIADRSVTLVAHNAMFEQVITSFVLAQLIGTPVPLDPSRWICTASLARALALKPGLAEASAIMKLGVQKDLEGHKLMLKMSKPRKPTKKNPREWHNSLKDLYRLMDYCATDVGAETDLFLAVPPLSDIERKVWELDQTVNLRGFRVDIPLVNKIRHWISIEETRLEREIHRITGGAVQSTRQTAKTRRFLADHGCYLPNLQSKTVQDALAAGLAGGKAADLLRVRVAQGKSSTTKYEGFADRADPDDHRVRDTQIYHGASTGRDTGSGVQPHNFPRVSLIDPVTKLELTDQAADFLAEPDSDLETIRLLYREPLDLFSNTLRSMIVPSDGCELFGGDLAGIEVRKLFWIARHEAGLQAYRDERDLYCEQASDIYSRKITKDHPKERQLGKETVLGSGFGLGAKTMLENCRKKGIEVTEDLAARAIASYRSVHYPVPLLWRNLEKAAIAAVRNPGKKYTVNRTSWYVAGKFLWCVLPSGRKLAYFEPRIANRKMKWGEVRPCLYHWDIHPKTKQWVLRPTWGGVLTENVVQGSARDVMILGKMRLEAAGYRVILTVHDEVLAERKKGRGSIEEFAKLQTDPAPFALDLPLKSEVWKGKRY
jgi:DNA polymerase